MRQELGSHPTHWSTNELTSFSDFSVTDPRARGKAAVSGGYEKVPRHLLSNKQDSPSIPTATKRRPRVITDFFWRNRGSFYGRSTASPQGLNPQGLCVYHQSHHQHPFSFLLLGAAAGRNIMGTELRLASSVPSWLLPPISFQHKMY